MRKYLKQLKQNQNRTISAVLEQFKQFFFNLRAVAACECFHGHTFFSRLNRPHLLLLYPLITLEIYFDYFILPDKIQKCGKMTLKDDKNEKN